MKKFISWYPWIIGLIVFSGTGCLSTYNSVGVVGIPVVTADQQYLLAIVAESEALSHQENGGFVQTTYYTSYWLKQYDLKSGQLLKKKQLVAKEKDQPITVNCYGIFERQLWLHTDELRAFDVSSLDEVHNEVQLANSNGISRNIFPVDERLFTAYLSKGCIDFIASNGTGYRLLLPQQTIVPHEEPVPAEWKDATLLNRYNADDQYGLYDDTLQGQLFALAKDSTSIESIIPASASLSPVSYRRRLFTARYTTRPLGNHTSFQYYDVRQQGSATYLNACFAKDVHTSHVVQLQQPTGLLIIHQDVLGSEAKAILTRIDTSNQSQWEQSPGISPKISSCFQSGQYVVITGNQYFMLSPHVGSDALCIVNTETGQVIRAALNE